MLTPEQCESYQRDGYLLVPNLFSKEQLAPALEVAEQNAYGKFEPVTAEGKTGTVLFYSSHMPHSPQAFTNPRKQRAVLFYAVGRRDTSTWTLTEKRDIQERGRLRPFLTKTTARVRSLFGWPNPGDDLYTPETLHLIKNAYPEMDLSPYY